MVILPRFKTNWMDMDRISVMGIVNITDNSYFAESRCLAENGAADLDAVRSRISDMLTEGADIIDIGACSTRPGAAAVGVDVEWARLEPVLRMLKDEFPGIRISIDTYWASVVRKTYDLFGPFIVNDIYAGRRDTEMLPTVGHLGLTYVAMHSLEETLDNSDYDGDVTAAVHRYFEDFAAKADEAGIKDWILDPGFGFGKSVGQNWQLLDEMAALKDFSRPILVGVSRKSMIYKPLGITPEESLAPTQAAHLAALERGATILRVHDVAPARQTIELFRLL